MPTFLIVTRSGLRYFAMIHPVAGLVFQPEPRLNSKSQRCVMTILKLQRDALLSGERIPFSNGAWVQRLDTETENK